MFKSLFDEKLYNPIQSQEISLFDHFNQLNQFSYFVQCVQFKLYLIPTSDNRLPNAHW